MLPLLVSLALLAPPVARVTIAAPNGTQPIWAFAQALQGRNAYVAFSPTMASSLVLPVVPSAKVPTAHPACGSLRNEPCRPYQAIANLPG